MSRTLEPFEVFAIRYAHHRGRRAEDNFIGGGDFHDADSPLDYYVWVVRRGAEVYLVDTGFSVSAAAERKRTLLISPAKALTQLGIDASTLEHVILTHLHYDHAGTLEDFPAATFHVQDAEPAYATGRCMCHAVLRHPYDVEDVVTFVRKVYSDRVVFHDGTSELSPGLTLHLVGGHSKGLQVVRVWTRRGWVVLASDATHLYANIERALPFPAVYSVGDMMEGFRRVRELADSEDHIIPGHDPQVMARYPAPDPSSEGVIVRLDVAPVRQAVAPLRPV